MQSELWGSPQDNHLDFDNKLHCGTNSYCLINLKHLWFTKIWVHEFCKHNLQNVYCKSPMHSLCKRVFGNLYIVTANSTPTLVGSDHIMQPYVQPNQMKYATLNLTNSDLLVGWGLIRILILIGNYHTSPHSKLQRPTNSHPFYCCHSQSPKKRMYMKLANHKL